MDDCTEAKNVPVVLQVSYNVNQQFKHHGHASKPNGWLLGNTPFNLVNLA